MPESPRKKDYSPFEALGIVWDVGLVIAIPTVLFALGGRWLDQKYGSSPIFLVVGLFLSVAVSGIAVAKMGKDIAKRL